MTAAPRDEPDPLLWCAGLALGFAALVWWRLGIPSKIYFDEVHYVPAARKMLQLVSANSEHPLVGKEAIAAAIALFGDRPMVWRIPSAIMGPLGLFAFGRALWALSQRRFATLAGMFLLATDFTWFIQSRIAMLDMVMAGFAMLAFWQMAAATRLPASAPRWRPRAHLALAGICIGLSLGAKWSSLPALLLACLVLGLVRILASGRQCLDATDAPPVRGVTLVELTFWLGSLPLAVYWASFWPGFHYRPNPIIPTQFVAWHAYMMQLQDSVVRHHPYQSVWWQWAINWRPIWYLYENIDGAQRGILLLGNPFAMLAGLAALPWCLWAGLGRVRGMASGSRAPLAFLARRRWEALLAAVLYGFSLALWAIDGKPVQFYYHYLMPGAFLMAALGLALDALWRQRGWWRWGAPAALVVALGMFLWFFPILGALKLSEGVRSFEAWMWLASWR